MIAVFSYQSVQNCSRNATNHMCPYAHTLRGTNIC
jgi:hypothetical protein